MPKTLDVGEDFRKKKSFKGLFRTAILLINIGGRLDKQPHHVIKRVVD
jgi:hypothetical protein